MAGGKKKQLEKDEARDLDIEISFLAGLTRRDPAFVEALQLLGDDYARIGDHASSLRVDEQVARLRPGDPGARYNLACSYALNANHEAAYHELARAIDAGYRDFRWLSRDPDLAGFRKHPLYRRIRAQVRRLRVKVE